uniref:T9SS type A sorting domain-containing protein n=1 Tax=Psychroflexus aestuariivivens TaxID=1795040 RepID=UPI000FD74144|nr:T9SS type A sorting domain-containing protein [Psychroflexus aestuariivivens]
MNEDGAYVTVDLSDGSSAGSSLANQYLQPGQAAFVRTIADSPASVTFTEASKNVNQVSNAVFSDNNEPRLNVRLYESQTLQNDGMQFDAISIRFITNGNNEVNNQDAPKMGNPAENLARLNGNDFLTIENRELPQDGEELDLAIYNYGHSNYKFEVDLSNFDENINVYLNDNYTNSQTELVNGINHIDFTVDASIPESIAMTRFSISFENTTLSVADDIFGNFSLYPNPTHNGLFIIKTNGLTDEVVDVKINNMLGQEVLTNRSKIESNGDINVNADALSSGIYLVKINQNEKDFVTKLIVK